MIQKRINLFVNPIKNSRRNINYYHKIRMWAIFISVLSFVSLLTVFVVQATLASNISRVEKEKGLIEDQITAELQKQITSHLVGMRVQTIEAALDQDINFASKEASLAKILSDFSINAKITSLSVPSKKDFTMTMTFPTEKDVLDFIRISESFEFADNFAIVKIGDFTLSKEASPSADTVDKSMTIVGQFL